MGLCFGSPPLEAQPITAGPDAPVLRTSGQPGAGERRGSASTPRGASRRAYRLDSSPELRAYLASSCVPYLGRFQCALALRLSVVHGLSIGRRGPCPGKLRSEDSSAHPERRPLRGSVAGTRRLALAADPGYAPSPRSLARRLNRKHSGRQHRLSTDRACRRSDPARAPHAKAPGGRSTRSTRARTVRKGASATLEPFPPRDDARLPSGPRGRTSIPAEGIPGPPPSPEISLGSFDSRAGIGRSARVTAGDRA